MYLEGKVVFVTGSSRGIGRAIAMTAADKGADVIIHYRKGESQAKELVQLIQKKGKKAALIQGDIGDPEAVIDIAEKAWGAFGHIDVLVNNAGISLKKYFMDTSLEEMDKIYSIDVRGTSLCTQEIIKRMISNSVHGRILTITSINAIRSGAGFSVYGGAKSWLEMSMKNLALEMAEHNILVNTFPVGAVKTDITKNISDNPELLKSVHKGIPMGRMGEAREIAETVCAFAGPAGDYVTGSSIVVDGGLSLMRGY